MSKIIKAHLDWNEEWGNGPSLYVLLDSTPQFKYQEREGLYLALDGDAADYIYWSGDGNTGGYGGRSFELDMMDGSKRVLLGPWSSRAECVCKLYPETPIIESLWTTFSSIQERGASNYSGAVTIASLKGRALPLRARREVKESKVNAIEAYIALLSDGSYDFVIQQGEEWVTKDKWLSATKGWRSEPLPTPAVIFKEQMS